MKTITLRYFRAMTIVWFLILGTQSYANSFMGTVVIAKGDVKILNSKIADGVKNNKFVLFEGQKYSYKNAKIGMRLRPGQVIHTGTNGKAKIAYINGDHMMVAPGTSVTLPQPVKGKEGTSSIKLIYGKMRSLISKNGPRSKLNIKTKSAVAGVRGTDFLIGHNPQNGMEVVVLRGEVVVGKANSKTLPTDTSKEKLKIVKTGYHAKVKNKMSLVEASKDTLLDVQASSHLELSKEELHSISKEDQKKIKLLEEKATGAILQDIKIYDPEYYKELKKQKLTTHNIHTQVVSRLYKQAPRPKKPKKANLDTIDQMGKGVYEKYFKE